MWGDTGRYMLVPVNTTTCKHTHTCVFLRHVARPRPGFVASQLRGIDAMHTQHCSPHVAPKPHKSALPRFLTNLFKYCCNGPNFYFQGASNLLGHCPSTTAVPRPHVCVHPHCAAAHWLSRGPLISQQGAHPPRQTPVLPITCVINCRWASNWDAEVEWKK
jgi:hypothetical protein